MAELGSEKSRSTPPQTRGSAGPTEVQGECPVDGRALPAIPCSTPDEILSTVASARVAQREWAKLSFNQRAKALKQAGKEMLERRQELLSLLNDETGKTPGEILMSEAAGPLQYIKDWIGVAKPFLKPRKLGISAMAFPGKKGKLYHLPRGVVGIISPWNYPLANFFKPLFPALLCGNAVVIKPSEFSPRTAVWMVGILNKYLPKNVLTLVHGYGEVAQTLIRSGVDAITFTGSYETGRKVAQAAGEQMIPCSLELGGKDAAIVLADCNLDRTVAGVLHWAFHNSGQACGAIDRVYVENSIADQFVEKLTSAVSRLVASGDPNTSDIGPIVRRSHLAVLADQVSDATKSGAKVLCGGKAVGKGNYFEPTVIDQCSNTMKVMREPCFGPIIAVCRVKDADEALRLSNDNDYGLNGSVWTEDSSLAQDVASRMDVGTAFINNHAFTGAVPDAPWTGTKHSGYGVANSTIALQHYTRPMSIVVDRKKSADAWWMPVDGDQVEMGHALCDAQLGKIGQAIKIPFLMGRRQKAAMNFVKDPNFSKKKLRNPEIGRFQSTFLEKLIAPFVALLSLFKVPLFQFEINWGTAAIQALLHNDQDKTLELSFDETRKNLWELWHGFPFAMGVAFRASCWIAGWAPLLLSLRPRTIRSLPVEEQARYMRRLETNSFYLYREIIFALKIHAGMAVIPTTRMEELVWSKQK